MNVEMKNFYPPGLALKQFPNETALIAQGEHISYHSLNQLVQHYARILRHHGLKPGQRLGLFLSNSIDLIVLLWASIQEQIIAVPLNTRFPADSILSQLEMLSVDLLIANDPSFAWKTLIPEDLKGTKLVPERVNEPDRPLGADQPATILFSSGSSGKPKAVQHTLGNHYYNALGSNMNIPLKPGDRWLLSLPLYHVGGLALLFRTALSGAALVIPENPQSPGDAIQNQAITHVSLVPTQFRRLLDDPDQPLRNSRLKAILLGGSAIPVSLLERGHRQNLPVFTSYGSTEMASQICTTAPGDSLDRLKTGGRILPYRDLIISHEGEILVKGDTLFQGYVDHQGLEDALDEEGWFHTGDLGYLDHHGYLTLTGRKDNMFISGGENIQPELIEKELQDIPEISRAVVLPIDDDEFGQRPVALLEIRESEVITRDVLDNSLRKRLPGYMIPVIYYRLPQVNEAKTLKVSRSELKEILKNSRNELNLIN